MEILRTPDERFTGLADWPYAPRYQFVNKLRLHYVDEGPPTAAPVLCLHGEPSWSYLYRKMIPRFVAAGHRVLAPDLIGFGRSDKPAAVKDYSYERHAEWIYAWLVALDLKRITLVCQDWGSLIGLRLAGAQPARFDRIVLSNGGLPTGDFRTPPAFYVWRAFALHSPVFPVGRIMRAGCVRGLSTATRAAYDAPFPDDRYKAGARAFPALVPTRPDNPASAANRAAWERFKRWDKPFLTAFTDKDPITRGGDRIWHKLVPGAQGQPHTTLKNSGHFVQEDCGEEFAEVVNRFIASGQ